MRAEGGPISAQPSLRTGGRDLPNQVPRTRPGRPRGRPSRSADLLGRARATWSVGRPDMAEDPGPTVSPSTSGEEKNGRGPCARKPLRRTSSENRVPSGCTPRFHAVPGLARTWRDFHGRVRLAEQDFVGHLRGARRGSSWWGESPPEMDRPQQAAGLKPAQAAASARIFRVAT